MFKRFLTFIFEIECLIAKSWASSSHRRLLFAQWGLQPAPEWFDHNIDLYFKWSHTNNSLWVERGVVSSLALKGGNVLELSCGDGFNAKNFYSYRSRSITACDFDESAIKTAKKKNNSKNVNFILADIRTDMPLGNYDNIIWDAAIEHFSPSEISMILNNVKNRLCKNGILSGYTIVENNSGVKQLHQHEYEFKDKADLKRFLTPYFKNVKVFETIFPDRHNLYFWASDGIIPFDMNWEKSI
jgi:2-polyprenyl-3-methyl-5-hydroxy-6-metoxy-1,4-benzoquinol methylase